MKQTKPCPTCGTLKPPGFRFTVPAMKARSFISYTPGEKDPRTIAAVDIPRKHGLDFGLAFGVVGGCLVGLLGATPGQLALTGIMSTAAVFAIVRGLGTRQDSKRYSDQWKWKLEEVANIDFDGDGVIGEPEQQTDVKYRQVYSAPRPDPWVSLKDFVRGCEQVGTAQNTWETKPRKMERDKYYELRDLLVRLGWAGWKNPNARGQGWQLLFTADQIIAGLFRGTMRDGSYDAPRPT